MLWLESPTGVGFSFSKNNATENHAGGDTRTGTNGLKNNISDCS
jgi:hypothetical protein